MILMNHLPFKATRQVTTLACEIASRSAPLVWERVVHRVLQMGASEAKGYIRSRAAEVVQREVDRTLRTEPQLRGWARPNLVAQATDGVVERTLNEILRIQRSRSMRRAA